jgi:hypothetical protein
VIDGLLAFLYVHYSDKRLTRDKLISELGSANPSINQLEAWVTNEEYQHYKYVSIYILDPFRRTAFYHQATVSPKVSMHFASNNQHLAPITVKAIADKIRHFDRIDFTKLEHRDCLMSDNYNFCDCNPNADTIGELLQKIGDCTKPYVLVECKDLSLLAKEVQTQTGMLIRHLNFTGYYYVNKFEHPVTRQIIMIAQDIEKRKVIANQLLKSTGYSGFTFTNQSYQKLAKMSFEISNGELPQDEIGPDQLDLLENYPITPFACQTGHNVSPDSALVSIDVRNCYPSQLINNAGDFPIFSAFDKKEPYEAKTTHKTKQNKTKQNRTKQLKTQERVTLLLRRTTYRNESRVGADAVWNVRRRRPARRVQVGALRRRQRRRQRREESVRRRRHAVQTGVHGNNVLVGTCGAQHHVVDVFVSFTGQRRRQRHHVPAARRRRHACRARRRHFADVATATNAADAAATTAAAAGVHADESVCRRHLDRKRVGTQQLPRTHAARRAQSRRRRTRVSATVGVTATPASRQLRRIAYNGSVVADVWPTRQCADALPHIVYFGIHKRRSRRTNAAAAAAAICRPPQPILCDCADATHDIDAANENDAATQCNNRTRRVTVAIVVGDVDAARVTSVCKRDKVVFVVEGVGGGGGRRQCCKRFL